MPTATYTQIASTTLSVATQTVTFSSISSAYRDLVLIARCATSDGSSDVLSLELNGGTSGYNVLTLEGDGSNGLSGSGAGDSKLMLSKNNYSINDTYGLFEVNFMDYAQTNKHKTILSMGGSHNLRTSVAVGRWASTDAITSITCRMDSSFRNFRAGSRFTLYGLVA